MLKLFKKERILDWQDYLQRIDTIDNFCFSQKVRKESIRNMQGAGR